MGVVTVPAGDTHIVRMVGSNRLRWAAPAALAALAAVDFLAQYLAAVAPLATLLHLPRAALEFLTVRANVFALGNGAIPAGPLAFAAGH